jgi:hypothetical protein
MAALSTVAAATLAVVSTGRGHAAMVLGVAVLLAGGALAWNAVGMLAVMDYSPPTMVGRGTGLVMLGFLTGYGAGAPLMGFTVDQSSTYTPGWLIVTCLFVLSGLAGAKVRRPTT